MSIEHALPPELLAVVNPTSWSYEAENPWWRKTMLEAVRDKSLNPADVTKIFRRYESSAESIRPDRSKLWQWRHRDWLDRALDRVKPFAPMLGGEVKIVRPHWMREVEGGAS